MLSPAHVRAQIAAARSRPPAWHAAAAALVINLIAAGVAMATDWRARFDPPPDQGSVASELALNGSAISAPIAPLALLAACALLARRQDRWRVLGLIGIAVTGLVFIVAAIGEITASPSEHTPQAVLIFAGILSSTIGAALITLAVLDLVCSRPRNGVRPL
ncbi:MAG: hypothetical protein M3N47_01105 [Chloroflexota bacterium]|nr:hypothetical protein [Chloroflexota bacterium]